MVGLRGGAAYSALCALCARSLGQVPSEYLCVPFLAASRHEAGPLIASNLACSAPAVLCTLYGGAPGGLPAPPLAPLPLLKALVEIRPGWPVPFSHPSDPSSNLTDKVSPKTLQRHDPIASPSSRVPNAKTYRSISLSLLLLRKGGGASRRRQLSEKQKMRQPACSSSTGHLPSQRHPCPDTVSSSILQTSHRCSLEINRRRPEPVLAGDFGFDCVAALTAPNLYSRHRSIYTFCTTTPKKFQKKSQKFQISSSTRPCLLTRSIKQDNFLLLSHIFDVC
ncbi:hypothetical protein V8C37DRAFT_214784 [Trichoderma ceciliae]